MDLFVLGPKNEIILTRRKQFQGSYEVNVPVDGEYTIVISNVKDRAVK